MPLSPVTTHALDLSLGRPARGLGVTLSSLSPGGEWVDLARGLTDDDGRLRTLLPGGTALAAGSYRLAFETGEYFQAGGVAAFYPEVVVTFRVDDPAAHYHIPLRLSPFGYSTYRGT